MSLMILEYMYLEVTTNCFYADSLWRDERHCLSSNHQPWNVVGTFGSVAKSARYF